MPSDQNDYEIFISYARRDNLPIPESYPHGWVTALKEQIVADHRNYSTAPLRIFFDQHEIRDMDDWRNRILGALRRSKLLLICLSPAYKASKPCKWEWDEFQARQHHLLVGSESHATVYFVEVPGSDEQDNAKWLAAIMGKNYTDLRPWFPKGAAAMGEEAVKQTMAVLGQSVWERLDRARRAMTVPGNLRAMTPYFVGRNQELADLHRKVGVGKIGLVTALHGLGGQGKTELAVAYARGYADCYPLGLWSLSAERKKNLLSLIGELASDPLFGYPTRDSVREVGDELGLAVIQELAKRAAKFRADEAARVATLPGKAEAAKSPAALLLLDNVSETELLSAAQLTKLPQADWLRVIATTRLDPKRIDLAGRRIETITVDSLDPENALRLIADHLPDARFKSAQDELAAKQIVRELGGFTLAIEQIAIFLGISAARDETPISPGDYLARLHADGLIGTDELVDGDVALQMLHQQKQIGPVVRSTLIGLAEEALLALRVAALLPSDLIFWPWLRELTVMRHPELAAGKPGHIDAWVAIRRQIEGLSLITPGERHETGRMHRMVAAHLKGETPDEHKVNIRRDVNLLVSRIVTDLAHVAPEKARTELLACASFALETNEDWVDVTLAAFLCRPLFMWGLTEQCVQLARRAVNGWRKAHAVDHDCAIPLVESLLDLGNVEFKLGHLNEATLAYAEGLETIESEGNRVDRYWRHAWCASRCHQLLADKWLRLSNYEPTEERDRMLDFHLSESQRLASSALRIASAADEYMEEEEALWRVSGTLTSVACTRAQWLFDQVRYEDAVQSCGVAVRNFLEPLPSFREREPVGGLFGGVGLILVKTLFKRPDLVKSIEPMSCLLSGLSEQEMNKFGNVPAILLASVVTLRLAELVAIYTGDKGADRLRMRLNSRFDTLSKAIPPDQALAISEMLQLQSSGPSAAASAGRINAQRQRALEDPSQGI